MAFVPKRTKDKDKKVTKFVTHLLFLGDKCVFLYLFLTEHFMKKSSIISFSKQGIIELGRECGILAHTEGLDAHRNSVLARLEDKNKE